MLFSRGDHSFVTNLLNSQEECIWDSRLSIRQKRYTPEFLLIVNDVFYVKYVHLQVPTSEKMVHLVKVSEFSRNRNYFQ